MRIGIGIGIDRRKSPITILRDDFSDYDEGWVVDGGYTPSQQSGFVRLVATSGYVNNFSGSLKQKAEFRPSVFNNVSYVVTVTARKGVANGDLLLSFSGMSDESRTDTHRFELTQEWQTFTTTMTAMADGFARMRVVDGVVSESVLDVGYILVTRM